MNVIETNFKYRKPLIPLKLEDIQYIIIHNPSWITASAQDIHDDVLADPTKKDWNGFPYNEYIRKNSDVYIGRGDYIGSQCAGMNSITYGISCEGNYDTELSMLEVQKQSLVQRIKYNLSRMPNVKAVVPHWHFSDTSCPGKNFPMAEVLQRIEVKKLNIQEAFEVQVKEGAMNSPDYWSKVNDTVKNFEQYSINISRILIEKNEEIKRLNLLIK